MAEGRKFEYRPDIDGLRALAVLAVVCCHAKFGVSGGFVGVDVFFVISGFLITSIIEKQLHLGVFSFRDFWERRVRRILPALVCVVIFVVAVGWFRLLPDAYAELGKSAIGVAGLVSNVYFFANTGYFASAAEEMPLLHTWSLAVEEQFYLFVPLLLFVLYRYTNKWNCLWVLSFLSLASLALSVWGISWNASATFYLLPTRAWELFAGCLLALYHKPAGNENKLFNEIFAWVGLMLIVIPCIMYTKQTAFPGISAIPPVLGTVILIWIGAGRTRMTSVGYILSMKPVVLIGLISYSLYLWHWPILVFVNYHEIGSVHASKTLLALALSFVAALLSWRYIELPFRNGRFLKIGKNSIYFGIISLVLMAVLGATLSINDGFPSKVSEKTRMLLETGQPNLRWINEHNAASVPDGLLRLGPEGAIPEILVWGDSHAMAILPVVNVLSEEYGTGVIAATHSATLPVVGYYNSEGGLRERAIPFSNAIIDYLDRSTIGSVVLVSSRLKHYLKTPACMSAFQETIRVIREMGISVYVVHGTPTFKYDVAKFAALYSESGRLDEMKLSYEDYSSRSRVEPELINAMISSGAEMIDPGAALFNGQNEFVPFDDSGMYYYDGGHLNDSGALKLRSEFKPVFEELRERTRPR